MTGGVFRCYAAPTESDWEYVLFNHAWTSSTYTVTVRMKRSLNNGALGISLGTGTSMGSAYGYYFGTTNTASYVIVRMNGYGYAPHNLPGASHTSVKNWTDNSAINAGDQWNVFKIVRTGSNYTFYANNTVLHSFSDSTYDLRYLAIVVDPASPNTQLDIDYIYVDFGGASTSWPGVPAPLTSTPATYDLTMGSK